MRSRVPTLRRSNPGERGYILIAILFVLAIMIIALTAVAPSIATAIKREREEEMIRRGKQYQRAIQLYYRKFGRFPSSLDQLQNTNNIRFLRKKYPDPISGKEEWKLIHLGEAKPKTVPAYLAGKAGAQPGGPAGTGLPGVSASNMSRPLSGSSSLGGGPIVGVASMSEKEAIKEIDGKTHYNEWEFTYDPTLDPAARQGAGPDRSNRPGRNPGQPTPPVGIPPR